MRTTDLEVRRIRPDGGGGLDNAVVLCRHCYELMDSSPAADPRPFDEETRAKALERAGNRCECESSGGCH